MIVLAVLVAWVLLGPIAMAFDGCAAMGALCEAPCGSSGCAIVTPTLSMAPIPASLLSVAPESVHRSHVPAGLEHPPKRRLASA
jgi:hypothetical protein